MKKTSQKILFFGNERLATGVGSTAPTFRALLASGYEIVALISSYTQARSRRNREPEIHEVARQHNIPIISPKRMSDIHDDIKKMDAVIGVLVAFGKIVPQSTIDLFPRGIINYTLPYYQNTVAQYQLKASSCEVRIKQVFLSCGSKQKWTLVQSTDKKQFS